MGILVSIPFSIISQVLIATVSIQRRSLTMSSELIIITLSSRRLKNCTMGQLQHTLASATLNFSKNDGANGAGRLKCASS